MATINIAELVLEGKAIVEYNDSIAGDGDWHPSSWCATNGFPYFVVSGDDLVLTGTVDLGTQWCHFRVVVVDAPEIPAPTGVELVVTGTLSSNPYGYEVHIGDWKAPDLGVVPDNVYIAQGSPVTDADAEGTARSVSPANALVSGEAGYDTGTLMLSFSSVVSQTPIFWRDLRGCGESIGSSAVTPLPPPEPDPWYVITQGSEPGYDTGYQGIDPWNDPAFGSYVAPDDYPLLYKCSGSSFSASLWIGVDLESDIVSATLSNGTTSIEIVAATALSGFVTDYSVVYGKPGVVWTFNDAAEADVLFDGTSELTLTVVFATP